MTDEIAERFPYKEEVTGSNLTRTDLFFSFQVDKVIKKSLLFLYEHR